jgi:ABC-type multidrug transport system permease subunit
MWRTAGKTAPLDVVTVMFFACQITLVLPFAYLNLYVADRRFYLVDVAANLYHRSAYHVAQTVAASPPAIVNGVVMYYLIYALADLRNSVSVVLLTGLIGAGMSLIALQIVAVAVYCTPNQDMAFMLGVAYSLLGILLAGFVVKLNDMQPVLVVISYITPLRYAFQLLVQFQFHKTPNESLLNYLGMTMNNGLNAGFLVIIYVVMHVLSYAAL